MPGTRKNGMRKSMKKQQQQKRQRQQKKQQRKSMKKGGARIRRTQRKVMRGGASLTKTSENNKLTLTLDEPYENKGDTKHNIVIVRKNDKGGGYLATMAEEKAPEEGLTAEVPVEASQSLEEAEKVLTAKNKSGALEEAQKYLNQLSTEEEEYSKLSAIIGDIEKATTKKELRKYINGPENTETYPKLRTELMKLFKTE